MAAKPTPSTKPTDLFTSSGAAAKALLKTWRGRPPALSVAHRDLLIDVARTAADEKGRRGAALVELRHWLHEHARSLRVPTDLEIKNEEVLSALNPQALSTLSRLTSSDPVTPQALVTAIRDAALQHQALVLRASEALNTSSTIEEIIAFDESAGRRVAQACILAAARADCRRLTPMDLALIALASGCEPPLPGGAGIEKTRADTEKKRLDRWFHHTSAAMKTITEPILTMLYHRNVDRRRMEARYLEALERWNKNPSPRPD